MITSGAPGTGAPALGRAEPEQTDPALREWQVKALRVLLTVIAVTSLPSYASTFYEVTRSGRVTVPNAMYFVVYTGFVVLALLPRLDQRIKAWLFLALSYANAIASFTQLGLAGSGRLYLLAIPIMATLIVDARAGYFTAGLSIVIYGAFTALAGAGTLAPWLTVTNNPLDLFFWGQAGSALLVFLAALVVLVERFTSLQIHTMSSRQQAMQDLERTAQTLREREERLELVVRGTNDGIWDWDLRRNQFYLSPRWKAMLGYGEAEIGDRFDDWLRLVHPDDMQLTLATLQTHLEGRTPDRRLEHRLRHKDGSYRWMLVRGILLRDDEGKPYRMVGSHSDITEQKQARDALQLAYQTLERRVEERTHALATLNDIAAVVSHSPKLTEVLAAALEKTMAIIGMESGAAFRMNGVGDELALMAHQGLSEAFTRHIGRLSLEQALAGRPMSLDAPVVWYGLAGYPEGEMKQLMVREKMQTILGVPLAVRGRLLGVLILSTRDTRSFSPEELVLLMAVGRQVGVAVENAGLYEQAERSAALAERTRLARELHDSVTQSLYSITLFAEAASRSLRDGEMAEGTDYLHELRDTAQEALREMRLLIFELRPLALEKSGLAAALQSRLESVEERGGMHAHLHVEGEQLAGRLPPALQSELYHLAREALNNVLKHARAQQVEVHLQYGEDAVRLDICDDGVGFVPASASSGEDGGGGLGLRGMRERAQRIGGQLRIDSAPGKGTRVSIDVPQMYEPAAPLNPPAV